MSGEVGAPLLSPRPRHNLYVWQRDGAHPAGHDAVRARPAAATTIDIARAQMTPDGRYLLFLTANKLVKRARGPIAMMPVDAYRYDAVSKAMVRVSTSVSGSGGNGPGFDVSLVWRELSSMIG